MKSIIALFGISGSGKTTLADYLVHHAGFAKIKTTTTRPKRTPQENDYHFTTTKHFKEQTMFAATKFDQHYYGTNLADIKSLLSNHDDLVVVLTWSGIVNYVKEFKDSNIRVYPIELFCPLCTALKRMDIRRDDHANKSNVIRRIKSYDNQAKIADTSSIHEYIVNSYASLPKSSNLNSETIQIKNIIKG